MKSIRFAIRTGVCALVATTGSFTALPAMSAESSVPTSGALTRDQVAAIVAAPNRSKDDLTNDVRRKPVEMLTFIGVRPGMQVLDIFAGGGYTTELLARAVGPNGRVYAQSPPAPAAAGGSASATSATPAASGVVKADAAASMPLPVTPTSRSAAAVTRRMQAASLGNITTVVQPVDSPTPSAAASGGLDLVTLMFNYHDLGSMKVDRSKMNRAIFAALKPGGTYVVADHAGRVGTGISESNTLHRIEEDFLKKEVMAAGFNFVGEGGFLRNPADPRDRETPEPAQPKDEFVLKFVKP